jgi:signal transduction histidine kinase
MEAIGQLTGGLAHDFNNMLTAIMGSLELLAPRLAGAGPGAEKFLAMAQDAAQRASALTQRLMAFARRQPLSPERVDASALILGMEELLRRTLSAAIDVRMQLADGLWPTLCDPNQLENAILNLAINARDAMPDGGRLIIAADNIRADAIYIRLHGADMAPGEYVRFAVIDTGIGMPPEIMARVFDPFFTTKPAGQGTGLGLSMIYGFAKQSGGDVQVASRPGRGTTFTLYLPRFNDRDLSAA